MKKAVKVVGYLLAVAVILVAGAMTYVKLALPNVGAAESLTITYTPERIAHGRYLAHSVTVCMDCHSKRDYTQFSGPLVEGSLGMGGERFDQAVGMPGVFFSRNITPEGITRYTDGELFRVITTGVNKEGKALFPLMPFSYYGRMDPEDIYDIIAYVRSIPVIHHEVPPSVPDFPMNFIINMIPQKAMPQPKPARSDTLAYGAYMVNAAACRECHTRAEKGQIIKELAFSGGREFKLPDGIVIRSSNLTPDDATGIGKLTKKAFVGRFKVYADSTITFPPIASGEFNTIMPWTMYGRMDPDDLGAIYTYLRSLKPVTNSIIKFTQSNK